MEDDVAERRTSKTNFEAVKLFIYQPQSHSLDSTRNRNRTCRTIPSKGNESERKICPILIDHTTEGVM